MMDQFASQLYERMQTSLQLVAVNAETPLQRAESSLRACGPFVKELNAFIITYDFKNPAEQIRFFKNIKPGFVSQQIYFSRLFQLESNKPIGSKDVLTEYYRQFLRNISDFFARNRQFYIYYRSGRTEYDDQIYVRNGNESIFFPLYEAEIDDRTSTFYSLKRSRIIAYEQLSENILTRLDYLENGKQELSSGLNANMVWTDSNSALVELAYALHARGSVNNGHLAMKEIISRFEIIFNVKLGNFYQVIKNMRARKKQRTVYLSHLIDSAEKRMDDTDMDF